MGDVNFGGRIEAFFDFKLTVYTYYLD